MPVDKVAVLQALLLRAREELDGLERVMQMARDEASSGESRAENKYDTRATEASYLAAGQGQRRIELARLVAFLELAVEQPSTLPLFEVDAPRGSAWFLLAPEGGGRRVSLEGADIVVVTPHSPVGRSLAGAEAGDTVVLGPGASDAEILAVW
jgi:hypothetical protein